MERLNIFELGSPQVRLEAKLAPLPSTLSLSHTHTPKPLLATGHCGCRIICIHHPNVSWDHENDDDWNRVSETLAVTFGMCVHGMSRKFLTSIPRILRANILGHQAERCPWLPFNSARLSKPLAAMFFPHRERQAIADGAKFLFILSSSPSEYIYIYK